MSFRGLALSLLVTALIATPALAGNPTNGINFGSSPCSNTFACKAQSDGSISNDTFASYGNSCVAQNFNLQIKDGYFETSGLDSSGCLRTKNVPKAKEGMTLTPVCCIEKTENNPSMCRLRCKTLGSN